MYFTRFRVNTARVGARKLLSSPQVLHAAVMASFVAEVEHGGGAPRVLWRLDHRVTATGRRDTLLYMVSPARPDLTHMVEQAGWPTTPEWETTSYKPFLDRLATGAQWRFRLTANPVHSIRRTAAEPTKRTAHVGPRHQAGWLLQRQADAGFQVLDRVLDPAEPPGPLDSTDGVRPELVVHNKRDLAFHKRDAASGKLLGVRLATVTYDGLLRVTDPDALRRTLTTGLGRGKAYGCGLLTLAPLEAP
jgi:CRISPR system Cascade subunit CasE